MQKDNVYVVTSVGISPEEERAKRFKGYLIAMIIRLVCIPLAIVLPFPLNVIAIFGAVFIPAFAVVNANSVSADSGSLQAFKREDKIITAKEKSRD